MRKTFKKNHPHGHMYYTIRAQHLKHCNQFGCAAPSSQSTTELSDSEVLSRIKRCRQHNILRSIILVFIEKRHITVKDSVLGRIFEQQNCTANNNGNNSIIIITIIIIRITMTIQTILCPDDNPLILIIIINLGWTGEVYNIQNGRIGRERCLS